MKGNLKQFLVLACDEILEGDLKHRAQQFVELTIEDQSKATRIVLAYTRKLRERTTLDKSVLNYMNPSTIPNRIKPIKKLLEMNDLGLGWKRIYSTFPELDNSHQGRGYTKEEIKKILEHSDDISTDFIILAFSSGAFRLGGWDGLTWKDVFPIYEINGEFRIELEREEKGRIVCGAITIYKGSDEQYTALISIEAWNKLAQYRKLWTLKMKRPPTDSDPLILERFSKPTPLTSIAVKRRIEKVLKRSQIRIPLTEGKRRHDVPLTNGFRRFYDKITMSVQRKKGTLASLVIKERLLGHAGILKTDKNYFWTDTLDLVPDYLDTMPELMINEESKLRKKLEDEQTKSRKLALAQTENIELRTQLNELEVKVIRIEKYQSHHE